MTQLLAGDTRPCPDMKIQAERDDLNVLVDVQGAHGAADIVDERHTATAETVIVVFELDRPVIPKCPLDAGARGPAE